MSEQEKGPGRLYRVVESFDWIEGGEPGPQIGEWTGVRDVVYEPGDTAYIEDGDLPFLYYRLEAIDEAGRAALEELRAKAKGRLAQTTHPASLDAEQRSNFAWGLADAKERHGELEPK